jgi:hypothetical protein
MNFSYKSYLKNTKTLLESYSELIFTKPLSLNEIIEIEENLGHELNIFYKEYLLSFGLIQDFIQEFSISRCISNESHKIPSSEYIVISSQEGFSYLMNSKNLTDDNIYKVSENEEGIVSSIEPFCTLFEKMEIEIQNLEVDIKSRKPNNEKKLAIEYQFEDNTFRFLVNKVDGIYLKSEWNAKTKEPIFFIPEEASIKIFGYDTTIYRHHDKSLYWIAIEECLTEINSKIEEFEFICKFNSLEINIVNEEMLV